MRGTGKTKHGSTNTGKPMPQPKEDYLIHQSAHLHCITGVSGVGKTTFMLQGNNLGRLDTSLSHIHAYRIKADTKTIIAQGNGNLKATLNAYDKFMRKEMIRVGRNERHFMTDRSPLCYTTHNIVEHMGDDDFSAFPFAKPDSPLIVSALDTMANFMDNSEYFYMTMYPLVYPPTDGSVRRTIEDRVFKDNNLFTRVSQCSAFIHYFYYTYHPRDIVNKLTVIRFLEELELFQLNLRKLAPIKY